jgi:hypothetical protein
MQLNNMPTILATIYVLIICFAFWGYGRILLAISSPGLKSNISQPFAFGIGIFIFGSGYLELFHFASAFLFNAFLCLGLLLTILSLSFQNRSYLAQAMKPANWKIKQHKSLLLGLLSIFTALICIFITFSYFYYAPLNVHDDFNGYLILCQRILQEGFQGGDPFNDHSIEQGFGAGNYILALAANFLPLMSLHLADAGIGILLLSALIIDALKKSSYLSINALGPCIFVLCVTAINAPVVNTTPLLLACGLFLAIIVFYIRSNFGARLIDHVLLALLLSSLLVLKGNYIIPVAAMSFCIYLYRIKTVGFLQTLKEIVVFLSCMFIFTLPWMISNWQFSQTPFYPLLGHGLVTPNALGLVSFNQFLEANLSLLPSYCFLIVLLIILIKSSPKTSKQLLFFISLLSITVIALSCALTMTSAGLFTRYSYVSLFGPTSFLFLYIFFNTSPTIFIKEIRGSLVKIFTLLIFAIVCAPQFLYGFKYAAKELLKTLAYKPSHVSQYIDIEKETHRVRGLQGAIPQQSTVLLRLDMPFLADFRTQKVSVMDWPGNVGPEPGVPFSEPPEVLAEYLRKQGIQYIIYSYKNEALFSSKDPELAERLSHPNPWIRTQALRTFAVQSQIESLGKAYRIIYDNGQDFVLDINQRAQ